MSDTETTATTDTASPEAGQDVATHHADTAAEAKAAETVTADAKSETTDEPGNTPDADKSKDTDTQGDKKPEDTVPEKYEFTAPEGVEVDSEIVGAFEPVAKDLGLTQAQADKLFGLYTDTILPRVQAAQAEFWANTRAEWVESAKADKEIGGDEFGQKAGAAKSALLKFAGDEFVSFLNDSGLGDHPEMIRTFYRISKSVSDDSFHMNGGTAGEVDRAKRFFPNMN